MLFAPQTEWACIARELTTPARLYTRYVMPLAALAALVAFVRVWLAHGSSGLAHGSSGLAAGAPLVSALALSTFTYGCELVGVYTLALIINALASPFGSARSQPQALKVAIYAFTPIWISSVFVPFPTLSTPMQLLGGIYYTYLLYLGLQRVMRSPRDRALGYAATVVLSSIFLGIVFTLLGDILGQAIHVGHYHVFG